MDPMEMASAGTSILGNLFSGFTGLLGGNQQAAADRARANQAEREASVNAQEALQQGNAAAAQGAVAAAAGGGGLTGSSMGAIQQASAMALFNARTNLYRGQTEASADLYDMKIAQANGINSAIGGVFGAAGSATAGAVKAQDRQSMLNSFNILKNQTPSYDDGSMDGLH